MFQSPRPPLALCASSLHLGFFSDRIAAQPLPLLTNVIGCGIKDLRYRECCRVKENLLLLRVFQLRTWSYRLRGREHACTTLCRSTVICCVRLFRNCYKTGVGARALSGLRSRQNLTSRRDLLTLETLSLQDASRANITLFWSRCKRKCTDSAQT
jgi:hypothetical protein